MAYHILCIDDDTELLGILQNLLQKENQVSTTISVKDAIPIIKDHLVDLIILDLNVGDENGLEALKEIKRISPSTDVVMLTATCDPKEIVQAIQYGAADYLCKPFVIEELTAVLTKMKGLCAVKDKNATLMSDLNPPHTHSKFIGASKAFRSVLEQASRVVGYPANILIQGESGTGKEIMARHIHGLEGRPDRPFIAINCAAIPEGLIEAELFGYEKGAFTGATQRKIGKFELANGGDIFLDEISCLRLDLQSKILRVLQEQEIVRVGGNTPIKVNFRVLAATNDHLEARVQSGDFRMDLYHRLRVILLQMPALRTRVEDIPLLVSHFLDKYSKTNEHKRITTDALRRLQQYSWPGNVRELENVIQSLVILTPHDVIDVGHLPTWTGSAATATQDRHTIQVPEIRPDATDVPSLKEFSRHMERQYIEYMLQTFDGDKTRVANTLNLGRTTLYGKLRELGIE